MTVHIERNFPDIANGFDRQYSPIAENIVRSGVYSTGARDTAGNLVPTASVPPLYTILYAASFRIFGIERSGFEAMRILQILLQIGVVIVVWRIGAMFGDHVGHAAALIAALDLTAFYFANNYETPDTMIGFLMALWFFSFIKFLRGGHMQYVWWSACALGLATLTKVVVFPLWIPLFVFLFVFVWSQRAFVWSKKLQILGIFIAAFFVFVGGWGLRNYLVTGYATLGSSSTPLRWQAAQLIAYQQNISLTEARQQLAERYVTEDLLRAGEGAADRLVSRDMLAIMLRSPIDYTMVTMRALPGLFLGTFPPYMLFSSQSAQGLMEEVAEAHGFRTLLPRLIREGRLLYVFVYGGAKFHLIAMFLFVGVACVALMRRASMRWVLATAVLMIAFTVAAAGAAAQTRHRTIVFPVFYVLGGYGVMHIVYWWQERRQRPRGTIRSVAPIFYE